MAAFATFDFGTQDGTELTFCGLKNRDTVEAITDWVINDCTDEHDLYFVQDDDGNIVRLVEWVDGEKVVTSNDRMAEAVAEVEDYFADAIADAEEE